MPKSLLPVRAGSGSPASPRSGMTRMIRHRTATTEAGKLGHVWAGIMGLSSLLSGSLHQVRLMRRARSIPSQLASSNGLTDLPERMETRRARIRPETLPVENCTSVCPRSRWSPVQVRESAGRLPLSRGLWPPAAAPPRGSCRDDFKGGLRLSSGRGHPDGRDSPGIGLRGLRDDEAGFRPPRSPL